MHQLVFCIFHLFGVDRIIDLQPVVLHSPSVSPHKISGGTMAFTIELPDAPHPLKDKTAHALYQAVFWQVQEMYEMRRDAFRALSIIPPRKYASK